MPTFTYILVFFSFPPKAVLTIEVLAKCVGTCLVLVNTGAKIPNTIIMGRKTNNTTSSGGGNKGIIVTLGIKGYGGST